MITKYVCRMEDEAWGDEDFTTETYDFDDAAAEFGQYIYDNRDGWEYMPKRDTEVVVKNEETKEEKTMLICTEFCPYFSAYEKQSPTPQKEEE